MSVSIVLADDQPLLRRGFRMILEAEPDLTVVGEAGNGEEAVDLAVERADMRELPRFGEFDLVWALDDAVNKVKWGADKKALGKAQEALAATNENFINSTFAYNVAKLMLARSLGVAERAVKDFLGGKH